MTRNKDASLRPEEISNQVAEGKEKQVEAGRKGSVKAEQFLHYFSFLNVCLRSMSGISEVNRRGRNVEKERRLTPKMGGGGTVSCKE